MTETQTNQTEVVDGFLIDTETGEILGLATLPERFAVMDQDSCDWVLQKIGEAESELTAIDQTAAVIHARAVLANAEAMKKDRQKKLDWLHKRFEPELAEYARKELEGKKTRTLKTLYGSVALRTVKGGLRVKDEETALAYAQDWAPEAIKTTRQFRISQLSEDSQDGIWQALMIDSPQEGAITQRAFEITPDREAVKIETGVGK